MFKVLHFGITIHQTMPSFAAGVVRGIQFCGAETEAVTSPIFWRFTTSSYNLFSQTKQER